MQHPSRPPVSVFSMLVFILFALAACGGEDDAGPRFVDNRDGTISDTASGLTWQQDGEASGQINLISGMEYCATLTLGGHTNWRLPTVDELLTLVNRNESNQHTRLMNLGFTNILVGYGNYITSSLYAGDTGQLWVYNTLSGNLLHENRNNANRALAVRR
jgi:hypothetical protein